MATSIAKQMASYQKVINAQAQLNNKFSAQQAAKQMAFQREMSNTAHQREVADLKAAGLNPALSVTGSSGSGASTPTGASGDIDMSTNSALTNYLTSLISQQTAIQTSMIQASATKSAAGMAAAATRYAADRAYENARDNPNTWAALGARLITDLGIRDWLRDNVDLGKLFDMFIQKFVPGWNGSGQDVADAVERIQSNAKTWQTFQAWLKRNFELTQTGYGDMTAQWYS